MAEILYKGTKEWLIYDVTDRLATLQDLAGTSPRFDVYDYADNLIVADAALSTNGMRAYALIDTTSVNFTPSTTGLYEVWLQFDTGPESPYLHGGDFFLYPVPLPA